MITRFLVCCHWKMFCSNLKFSDEPLKPTVSVSRPARCFTHVDNLKEGIDHFPEPASHVDFLDCHHLA